MFPTRCTSLVSAKLALDDHLPITLVVIDIHYCVKCPILIYTAHMHSNSRPSCGRLCSLGYVPTVNVCTLYPECMECIDCVECPVGMGIGKVMGTSIH